MKIQAKEPCWANAEKTAIDVKVNFVHLPEPWVDFTATANDCTEHGREIYRMCINGKLGPIKEYRP